MLVEYCFSVEKTLQSYKKSVLVLVEYITYDIYILKNIFGIYYKQL